MNRPHTNTQLKKACGFVSQQDQEFNTWIKQQNFNNVKNISEYAEWDTVGQCQCLWDQYQTGTRPWDLIIYFNNTKIVELGEVCQRIDSMIPQLADHGQIYLALNKWCVKVDQIDAKLSHLDFDTALPIYVQQNLKNFVINDYRYIPDDRGGLGNWLHGNSRFWLVKNEKI
jgi:hypothetical protein